LVNAATDVDIRTLKNGDTINLNSMPTSVLNIRANTYPSTVGSVKMSLTGGQIVNSTETNAPYALFGDINGNYNNWTPLAGKYTLTGTPYTAGGGTGTIGTPLTINFTVGSFALSGAAFGNLGVGLGIAETQAVFNSTIPNAFVHPNPSNGSFRFQYKGSQNANISIYSTSGVLLEVYQNVSPEQVLDLGSSWNSGIYYVLVKTIQASVVKRLVKQ
jgi:hypothetical protein